MKGLICPKGQLCGSNGSMLMTIFPKVLIIMFGILLGGSYSFMIPRRQGTEADRSWGVDRVTMPAVASPVDGCAYVTADAGDAVGAVLLKFHLDTHTA